MHELFFKKLREVISLSEEEEAVFRTYLLPKKIRKKQYILQEGDVCRYTVFVEKGILRSYTINEKGNEQIVQFALEGWWISDMYSMITGEPAKYNIDALEDAELILIRSTDLEILQERIPLFLKFSFLQMRNAYIAFERRLTGMATLGTEERYTKLVQSYPDIVQRVPQHMIASYLGLTAETLSRARKHMSNKK